MNILGLDIGGKTRNGICLMDSESKRIIKYSYIVYDTKETPLAHRYKVLKEIGSYMSEFKIDYIVFERINLFRGQGVSPLANIISLCKLQTTLIDNLSDKVNICDVAVRSWKSRVLGKATATKEDSISQVTKMYPEVDLKIPKYSTKDPNAFEWNHDLADACMIAYASCKYPELLKNKVNYK